MPAPSIRTLAARLGLSHATVSEALRGSLRVKEETRRRVVEQAELMGYRPDPIASELMARMRRSRAEVFRGLVAVIAAEPDAAVSPACRKRRALLREAAERRAAEGGFKLDPVLPGSDPDAWARLVGALHARNVSAALLLPSDACLQRAREQLGRAPFPVVYLDSPEEGAEHVDAVAPDYRQALGLARLKLAEQGCKRPGLLLCGSTATFAVRRWLTAADALRSGDSSAVVPLVLPSASGSEVAAEIARWSRKHDLDAIVTEELLASASVPIASLDQAVRAGVGLDLRWSEIGARAVEIVTRQYFDRLHGRRESPALLSLPVKWLGQSAGAADAGLARESIEDRAGKTPLVRAA